MLALLANEKLFDCTLHKIDLPAFSKSSTMAATNTTCSCSSTSNGISNTWPQSKIRTQEVVLFSSLSLSLSYSLCYLLSYSLCYSLSFSLFLLFNSIRRVHSVISVYIRISHMHTHDCDTNSTMKYLWCNTRKKKSVYFRWIVNSKCAKSTVCHSKCIHF